AARAATGDGSSATGATDHEPVGPAISAGGARPSKAVRETRAEGIVVDGSCDLDNFLGHRVRIEIKRDTIVMTDQGIAPDETVYSPRAPSSRYSWSIDVLAGIAALPADVREQLTVGALEHLPAESCPTCGGTKFRMCVGGCPVCDPVVSDRVIERAIEQRWRDVERQRLDEEGWLAKETERRLAPASIRRCMSQLRCDESYARWAIERGLRDAIREEVQRLIDKQQIGSWPTPMKDEIRATLKAADPRSRWATRLVNLRHARQRITVTGPRGALDITFWERVNDADSYFMGAYPKSGVTLTPDDGGFVSPPVLFGIRGGDAIFNDRAALRYQTYKIIRPLVTEAPTVRKVSLQETPNVPAVDEPVVSMPTEATTEATPAAASTDDTVTDTDDEGSVVAQEVMAVREAIDEVAVGGLSSDDVTSAAS
ncbi:MAG: hypothetical protein ACHREM_22660, partial [Polyangiales bacterium]